MHMEITVYSHIMADSLSLNADLRDLEKQEMAILKLKTVLMNQLNRLQIEELALNSRITEMKSEEISSTQIPSAALSNVCGGDSGNVNAMELDLTANTNKLTIGEESSEEETEDDEQPEGGGDEQDDLRNFLETLKLN